MRSADYSWRCSRWNSQFYVRSFWTVGICSSYYCLLGFAFGISSKGNTVAVIKLVSGIILIFLLGIVSYMLLKQDSMVENGALISSLYQSSAEHHAGGGYCLAS